MKENLIGDSRKRATLHRRFMPLANSHCRLGMPPDARADHFFPGGTAFAAPYFSVCVARTGPALGGFWRARMQAKQHVKMNVDEQTAEIG